MKWTPQAIGFPTAVKLSNHLNVSKSEDNALAPARKPRAAKAKNGLLRESKPAVEVRNAGL
ncbi:MAG: hypothetical protein FJ403_18500 [Verrucomicrobia bacterium]|nr:hypothetical protein [Verrucomicrobiota bacterium]